MSKNTKAGIIKVAGGADAQANYYSYRTDLLELNLKGEADWYGLKCHPWVDAYPNLRS